MNQVRDAMRGRDERQEEPDETKPDDESAENGDAPEDDGEA